MIMNRAGTPPASWADSMVPSLSDSLLKLAAGKPQSGGGCTPPTCHFPRSMKAEDTNKAGDESPPSMRRKRKRTDPTAWESPIKSALPAPDLMTASVMSSSNGRHPDLNSAALPMAFHNPNPSLRTLPSTMMDPVWSSPNGQAWSPSVLATYESLLSSEVSGGIGLPTGPPGLSRQPLMMSQPQPSLVAPVSPRSGSVLTSSRSQTTGTPPTPVSGKDRQKREPKSEPMTAKDRRDEEKEALKVLRDMCTDSLASMKEAPGRWTGYPSKLVVFHALANTMRSMKKTEELNATNRALAIHETTTLRAQNAALQDQLRQKTKAVKKSQASLSATMLKYERLEAQQGLRVYKPPHGAGRTVGPTKRYADKISALRNTTLDLLNKLDSNLLP